MNLKAIEACLLGKELATEQLFNQYIGQRCAIGEILHACGVPDEKLKEIDGEDIMPVDYPSVLLQLGGSCIKDTFGIENEKEIKDIYMLNDDLEGNSKYIIERLSDKYGQ